MRKRNATRRRARAAPAKRTTRRGVVRVALVQAKADARPERNLERTLGFVAEAAKKGAQIVCLQELFRSEYFPQVEDASRFELAETIPGPTTDALQAAAREHGVAIVGSVFERRAPGLYHNTAVVVDADGTLLGTYRKMHVPEDPRFYEKFYFAPGDQGFKTFDTAFGRIGVLVCWDQWYPEAARLTALQGASILFYPTAIGTWTGERRLTGEQRDAWRTVQRAHAIANGVFVAAANRVGKEGELRFWGSSFVAKPSGAVAGEASPDAEEILIVDCDLGEVETQRQGWPFLRDRRVDAYGPLSRRFIDRGERGGSDPGTDPNGRPGD
jgi:N-carbamoylputrescine amidase